MCGNEIFMLILYYVHTAIKWPTLITDKNPFGIHNVYNILVYHVIDIHFDSVNAVEYV